MPNNQLPPGWGSQSKNAKPNWAKNSNSPFPEKNNSVISENKAISEKATEQSALKREIVTEEKKIVPVEVVSPIDDVPCNTADTTEKVTAEETRENIASQSEDTASTAPEKAIKPIIDNETKSTDTNAKAKSKTTVIVVIIIIIIVAILAVLAYLYFSSKGKNAEGSTSETNTTTETTTVVTTAPVTTPIATTTTTTTTQTTPVVTTTTITETTTTTIITSTEVLAPISDDRTYDAIVQSFDVYGKNVYSSPSYDSSIIKTMNSNEQFQVDSYIVDEYSHIWFRLKGDTGWVDEYQFSCAYLDYFYILRSTYLYNEFGEWNTFAHYDIDKDGTDEWIFEVGEYTFEKEYDVYTAQNNTAVYLGSIPYGTLFISDEDELITTNARMDYEAGYIITLDNGVLSSKLLFENYNVSDYSTPGERLDIWMPIDIFGDKSDYYYSG